ncbi:BLUF domain-containing protein [Falsiroseomonas oryzae]|uniref:BLUF domain-containing protein n=1 Tax=Falsiroseomonas oryzae TaxID=2766473 RepID=UPI0022EB2673|nr:BLUF domain-containing protein [Roseomonas sp. MO-31]
MSTPGTTTPDAALRRVIYVSHAVADPAQPMEAVIGSILDAARRNNARTGVTGALLYSQRRFAQVLEGPPAAVERIFETIQCDLRHDHVTVLEVSSPATRAFGDWSMAFAGDIKAAPGDIHPAAPSERVLAILQQAIRNTEAATA